MIATLKGRVLTVALLVTAVSLVSVAAVILATTQRGANAALNSDLEQLALANASQISSWAASKQRVVQSLVPAIASDSLPTALSAAATAGDFDDVYVGYSDKRAIFYQQRTRAADYDPTKRGWYKGAAADQKPFISLPYVGAGSKKLTVTFTVPIIQSGAVSAVAAADVLMESVQTTLAAIKPTPSSLAFLVSADGTVVAHPDASAVLKPVGDVFSGLSLEHLAQASQAGASERLAIGGRDEFILAHRVEGTPWQLVILVDANEALGAIIAARHVALAMVVVALLIAAVVLSMLVSRSMRSLDRVRDAMESIASGNADLTKRLDVNGGREIEQISQSFNRFVEAIAEVLRRVKASSEQVMSGSTQLAGANQDLSARTERQAAALEQTSASAQTLASTVSQNSERTAEAAKLAMASIASASRSRETVLRISDTMGEISQLASRISAISSSVNGIASQTNILALNAAVESARAGAAGRGFAVVASEVRQLAQRTAESAREISVLAKDAQSRVGSASELVGTGVTASADIAQSADRLSKILDSLAGAGSEQAIGLEEVRQALLDLDDVTQQNAALVEEASSATDALASQSVELAKTVETFSL
ncbi:methyl-accepting chemotaxis protein [Pandoraea anhela]|uniref:Chemotaxis protein n=1 Tax=Pandoraea anhela TaxID=2508295 RepID=A0A5E4Z7L0_9BURK|nr:methyl-accepting chemotaxis protein [Pandoraea anhela]VVE57139.1 chemotaxis protein [Pandoraea anhela]